MENLKIQFDIRSKELLKALSILSSAIPSSALVPIYTYVKVEGYKGSDKIFLTASDAKITIKTFAQVASIEFLAEETCFVMPFDEISRLLKSSPDGPVTVKYYHDIQKDGAGRTISDVYGIVIVAQTKEYTFAGEEASTFPVIQTLPKSSFKIDCAQLKEGIGYMKNIVTDIENAPNLSGVYFDTKEPNLTLVGFDGVLMLNQFVSQLKSAQVPCFTMPVRMVKFLADTLRNSSDEIEIAVSDKQVSAEFDQVVIHSVLLTDDQPFITYKSDNPPAPELTTTIDLDEWKQVLTRAMITADHGKAIDHNFQEDYCFVNSENVLLNKKSSQDMKLEDSVGNPVSVTVNGERLQKLLSGLGGPAKVNIAKTHPGAVGCAVFILPEVVFGKSMSCLIMPIMKNR